MCRMRRFFNPDSLLWKLLGIFGDLVTLSLLWAVCSIPLVTLGASTAALYDTAVHALRRKDDSLLSRFFSTLRRELLEGVGATLLGALPLLALYALYRLFSGLLRAELALMLTLLGLFFLLGFLCWLAPTLSRFTMKLDALFSACARLWLGNALRSAALALLAGATLVCSVLFVFPVFFLPALAALGSSYLIEPVFLPYEQSGRSTEEQ